MFEFQRCCLKWKTFYYFDKVKMLIYRYICNFLENFFDFVDKNVGKYFALLETFHKLAQPKL